MRFFKVFLLLLITSSFGVGVSSRKSLPPSYPRVELRAAETQYAEGLTQAVVARTGDKVYVHREAAATEKDILSCHLGGPGRTKRQRDVVISLTGAGADAVEEASAGQKLLALVLDGKVIAAERVNVSHGYCIFPGFSPEEARRVADAIDLICIRDLIGDRGDVPVEVRLAYDHPAEGLAVALERNTRGKVYLSREPLISRTDVLDTRVVRGHMGDFRVELTLTAEAGRRIEGISETRADEGAMIAEVVGGRVVAAAYITGKLGLPIHIYGDFTKEEAEIIARAVNAK